MTAAAGAVVRAAIIAAAILAVAACNAGSDRNEAEGAQASAPAIDEPPSKPPLKPAATPASVEGPNAAIEAAVEPEQTKSIGVTRAWFAGKWTDTGDCADAGRFEPSGIFQLADGTRGMWNIQNGRLVTQQGDSRNMVGLRKIDSNEVEVLNEDGSAGRSTRC